jgi:3-oxoacyl-[acyl-carrier protein] reductase
VRRSVRATHSRTMGAAEPLPGRVAIVTGASRGVGREMVRRLATRGYAVVVDYAHDQRAADSIVEEVLARHGAAVAIRADVTDDLDVARLFSATIEAFGGIDVVVHAVHPRLGAHQVAAADPAEFDAPWTTNARAAVVINREAARQVRDGGAIVNLSAAASGSAMPTYAPTTAAIGALTRLLALELLERDITVNAVSLNIDTPCTPGRTAEVITYLLSREGRAITGQVIRIDDQ